MTRIRIPRLDRKRKAKSGLALAWLVGTALSLSLAGDDPDQARRPTEPQTTRGAASASSPSRTARSKTATKTAEAPPTIATDDAAKARRAADFLRGPGAGRYGETDWSRIPRWRQTAFYGIRAEGQVFLYVIDCSGSMDQGYRLQSAKAELRRSVNALRFPQRFHVIFFNHEPIPMPGDMVRSADADAKADLSRWLSRIDAGGETDPRGALKTAISLRPDAVFLLTDGEFPEGTAEMIARSNKTRVPIHCVDLSGGESEQLRRIARDSRGKYVRRH